MITTEIIPSTRPRRTPAPRKPIDEERVETFLRELATHGSATAAAVAASPHLRSHGAALNGFRSLADRDPAFRLRWEQAHESFRDSLRREAHRRAVDGIERNVYRGGELMGTERVYSDSILLKLLASHCPEFADRRIVEGRVDHVHSAAPGHSLTISLDEVMTLDTDQRRNLADLIRIMKGKKPVAMALERTATKSPPMADNHDVTDVDYDPVDDPYSPKALAEVNQ